MRNGAEEMIMMRWQQQQQQRQWFAWRPHERLWEHKNKKGRDPLLCKCLVAMGMYAFVDHFDNFNQFFRMSPDQCRLYGPKFVVRYAKLHAGIEAQCANPFSVLDFGPYDVVDGEPEEGEGKVKAGEAGARAEVEGKVEAGEAGAQAEEARAEVEGKVEAGEAGSRAEEEEEEEEGVHGNRVQPRSALRRGGGGGGGLIPCMEQFCWDDDFNDAQMIQVCSHPVGTCDAIQRWSRRTELN
ncbi:hypothetical protein D5F01_LYC20787 [Larimichthys crocea]|uniref:Uncharacterized protein n=1 Tax=Larimichthys crocea TaxID=215358 RepID=A0A6G0HMC5_LARCR|nr:hypothetical protein D5F01_LYC20787 [Larimichthys crocea]